MTDHSQDFDRLFGKYGGVVDLATVQPPLDSFIIAWRSFFNRIVGDGNSQPFPTGQIQLDYVDNSSINAIAAMANGQEFIGFFMGASAYIHHCFTALSMVPEAFGGDGEVSVPIPHQDVRRALSFPTKHLMDFIGECDTTRAEAAEHATSIVHFFLFGHEVGHHVYGHLWYLAQNRGVSELSEEGAAQRSPVSPRERQLMELDADMHGAVVSLNWWMRVSRPAAESPFSAGVEASFHSWAYALGILFRLLDVKTGDPATESTHPSPDLRFMNVFLTGVEEVRRRVPGLQEAFVQQVHRAIADVTDLWVRLDMNAPSFSPERSSSVAVRLAAYRSELEVLKDVVLDPAATDRAAKMLA